MRDATPMPGYRRDEHTSHNFDEPDTPRKAHFGADDIGWQVFAPAIGCTLLATIVVCARWYSRCRLAQCVGVDDYVILLSVALSWAMTATIGASVHEGIGVYHSQREASTIAKLVVAGNVLWILIVNITKASLLTQYLRIFSSPRTRALCYTLLLCLLPAVLWAIFGGIFLCHPVAKLWDPDRPGTCRSAETYWLSVAGLDISLDLLILLLPLPAILALRLPPRQKLALVLVFALGFFVCAVSIARLATVYITAHQGRIIASAVWAVVWSAAEANVGIVCASLLALKPLAAKWWPRLFDETRVPRHSMRLKPVDTSAARWSQVRFSGSVETLAGVGGEKQSARPVLKRWSTAKAWVRSSMQKVSEAEEGKVEHVSVGVREPERVSGGRVGRNAIGAAQGEGEEMGIWDVLRRGHEGESRGANERGGK